MGSAADCVGDTSPFGGYFTFCNHPHMNPPFSGCLNLVLLKTCDFVMCFCSTVLRRVRFCVIVTCRVPLALFVHSTKWGNSCSLTKGKGWKNQDGLKTQGFSFSGSESPEIKRCNPGMCLIDFSVKRWASQPKPRPIQAGGSYEGSASWVASQGGSF